MTSTRSITGAATSVAAVIGSPIRHSLSPVIHNAAFAACDLDWTYVAFDVVAADASAAIDATRTLGLAGLSVTMPLKQAVMSSLDGLTDVARRLGAVNCIFWDGDDLVGDNTDGAGFLTGLRRTWGVDLKGSHVAVIGSGGAAAAVVDALAGAGAGRIDVVARNPERASEVVGLGGGVARWASAEEAGRAHVIVNATPVGMSDVPGQPLSTAVHPELLRVRSRLSPPPHRLDAPVRGRRGKGVQRRAHVGRAGGDRLRAVDRPGRPPRRDRVRSRRRVGRSVTALERID